MDELKSSGENVTPCSLRYNTCKVKYICKKRLAAFSKLTLGAIKLSILVIADIMSINFVTTD